MSNDRKLQVLRESSIVARAFVRRADEHVMAGDPVKALEFELGAEGVIEFAKDYVERIHDVSNSM